MTILNREANLIRRALSRMPEAVQLFSAARAGEMSPNSIPKYLKRPLWRERKCEGRGESGAARPWDSGARASRTASPARRPHSSAPPYELSRDSTQAVPVFVRPASALLLPLASYSITLTTLTLRRSIDIIIRTAFIHSITYSFST